MSTDSRHDGIIQAGSVIAAIVGLLFGWFPGADLFILIPLWIVFSVLIVIDSDVDDPASWLFRFVFSAILSYIVIAGGVEIATLIATPIFFIVNPFLNYHFTKRILRATSKLFIKEGPQGVVPGVLRMFWFFIKSLIFSDAA